MLISIVIPVKNGEFWLQQLFEKLQQQTLFQQSEIIVIDSGSTDRSVEIISQYPVRLIQIPSSEFNHGQTRNIGVQEARGKYVVMTVQDALPVNEFWLQHLLDGFINDNVAGVCGQQIVAHEKENNPAEWFFPLHAPAISSYHFDSPDQFENLAPGEKKGICGWDNVTACYRKDALLTVPFQKINFAEDLHWAKDALLAGYTIVYNTGAQVYHYHQMDADFSFKRGLTELYYRYKILGYKPEIFPMTGKKHLQLIFVLLKRTIPFREKWRWWKYNLRNNKEYIKAQQLFLHAVNTGEDFLDETYNRICSTAPQAKSIKRNEQ